MENKTFSLYLKPIDNKKKKTLHMLSSKKAKNFHHDISEFKDQEVPFVDQKNHDEVQMNQASKNILMTMIQDPRKSYFAHKKYLLFEKILFLLVALNFFLSIVKTQIDLLSQTQISNIICNLISVSTFLLIICLILRYVAFFQLKVHQKKVFIYRISKYKSIFSMFWHRSDDLLTLFIQILMILPHPNIGFINIHFSLFQSMDQIYIYHELNDLMSIFMLIRIYIVMRSLVNITIYSTPRSSRLCQQNGVEHNLLFSIKCILNQQPLRAIALVFVISTIFFGAGLKFSQGILSELNPDLPSTGFQSYGNCFWCVFITMGTIGYGDYFPKTLLGRMIIFVTAITGVILSSLLIVSLSSYLQMQASQSKSHITLQRLLQQQKLQGQSKQALCRTIKLCNQMKMNESGTKSKVQNIFMQLKRKIDLVRIRSRKIKSLIDTDNIIEEMNRLFQILKDNLRDIYQNQNIIKAAITKLQSTSIRGKTQNLTFAKQMGQAMKL